MKWRTPEPRPYYSKYESVPVKNSNGWFDCYKLPGDVYVICEPQHLQEVNVFLILGDEKALLLDTGMGVCDIRPLVEELCGMADAQRGKPAGSYFDTLEVVNCHAHFDHTGCNWRFKRIWAVDCPLTRHQAEAGVAHEPLLNQTNEDMFLYGYPEGYKPEEYRIRPYTLQPCEDGHIFDLGNRDVEFVWTPGHTEDHAMLYDHKYDILFSGDMVYFEAIYVQFDSDILGHSDINEYIASLQKLKERFPDVKTIYVSHNDFISDPSGIEEIMNGMIAVRDGLVKGELLVDENWGYYGDPPTTTQYMFDNFSIIAGF